MIREGLVDEQCFKSADQASLALFLPTTQDMTDSESEVTIKDMKERHPEREEEGG